MAYILNNVYYLDFLECRIVLFLKAACNQNYRECGLDIKGPQNVLIC